MKNLNDLREQIQEDIITFFDGKEWEDGSDIDQLCQIIVDRFKELEKKGW